MTLYIGVDFHPHQQTVCWCDIQTGELQFQTLFHKLDEVRAFYQQFPPSVVGIEATCKADWFENLLAQTHHQLVVGHSGKISKRRTSRRKSDKDDALLIFNLLLQDEFPKLWRRTRDQTQVLEILKSRLDLVRQRTQIYNRLQALAHNFGLPKASIKTKYYQEWIKQAATDQARQLQRQQLFALVDYLTQQIEELESWQRQKAAVDTQAQLLMTQKGVGYMTGLCLVNTIGDLSRFTKPTRQVAAFIGIDPLGRESAGKMKAAGISRAGSFDGEIFIRPISQYCGWI